MATQADNQGFSFETSYEHPDRLPWPRSARRTELGITEDEVFVALGVVMLGLTTFAWVMRDRKRATARRIDALRKPPGRVSIRVTEAGYSQRGDGFFTETSWGRISHGTEIDGYLLVASRPFPLVHLPIEEMKRAGVYERVNAIGEERNAEWRAFVANVRGGDSQDRAAQA